MGSAWTVPRSASRRDLPAVSAGGVFDRTLERGRLAALRGGRELRALAARAEQGRHAGVAEKEVVLVSGRHSRKALPAAFGHAPGVSVPEPTGANIEREPPSRDSLPFAERP